MSLSRTLRFTLSVMILSSMLMLSACGGGGGNGTAPTLTETELEDLRSDPRIIRLDRIAEQATTVIITGVYLEYDISVGGTREGDSLYESISCTGTRCISETGEVVARTGQDLFDSDDPDINVNEVVLGSRDGFDTGVLTQSFEWSIPGVTITSLPSATSYGIWGDYGFAAVEIMNGPFAARADGQTANGTLSLATSFAAGIPTGTNPVGVGSARWSGVATAASVSTFQRREGTTILTIADLAAPRISADIDIPGYAIGSSFWINMPLEGGLFSAGIPGVDYIGGGFGGPQHEEAYGVFDTGTYIGAFGAQRDGLQ